MNPKPPSKKREAEKSKAGDAIPSLDVAPPAEILGEVPPEMEAMVKLFSKTPIEALTEMFPNANQGALDGFVAGLLPEPSAEIPVWAREASRRFWEASGIGLLGGFAPENNFATGAVIGLADDTPKEEYAKHGIPITELSKMIKEDAANAPVDESKQFFDGRANAIVIDAKLAALQQRSKIYMTIALGWQDVRELKSVRALFGQFLQPHAGHAPARLGDRG